MTSRAHPLRAARQRRRRVLAGPPAAALAALALLLAGCAASDRTTSAGVNGTIGRSQVGGFDATAAVVPGWDCGASCSWASVDADRTAIEAAVSAHKIVRGQGEAASRGGRTANVDDNESFAAYLTYRAAYARGGAPVLPLPVEGRQLVTVVDAAGQPVRGATIAIADPAGATIASLTTYPDGRAVFDPPATTAGRTAFTATVTKGAALTTVTLAGDGRDVRVTLPGVSSVPLTGLDVMFVLDATASMHDALARLQAQVDSVTTRLQALPGHPHVRLGLTVYRDRGELFTTRTYSLTDDPAAFAAAVREVQAGGGGDTLEDLQGGLWAAITRGGWGDPDTAKVLVLVGDGPPHLYPEEDGTSYAAAADRAAAAGIKIFAIGANDLDEQGEYVFRQLAQRTLGRYVYLTSGPNGAGASGAGGPTTLGSVTAADRLALDDLAVLLVASATA